MLCFYKVLILRFTVLHLKKKSIYITTNLYFERANTGTQKKQLHSDATN